MPPIREHGQSSEGMEHPHPREASSLPSPLSRLEIAGALGAALMAIGVFLPAASAAWHPSVSFIGMGRAAGALTLAWSALIGHAVAVRKLRDVAWGSALGIGLLVSFRSAVAADTTADQGSLSLTAWLTIIAGATLSTVAAFRSPLQTNSRWSELQLIRIGVVLVAGGCLAAVVMTNPFSENWARVLPVAALLTPAQHDLVRVWLLGGATVAALAGWVCPSRARRYLAALTGLAVFLAGNGLLVILSREQPLLAVATIPWSLAALVTLSTLSVGVRPRPVAWLVLGIPFALAGAFFVALGEFEDGLLAIPPVVAIVSGSQLSRSPQNSQTPLLIALVGVGVPLALIRMMGGESGNFLGLRPAEDRMLTWMMWAMLAWGWILSLVPLQRLENGV